MLRRLGRVLKGRRSGTTLLLTDNVPDGDDRKASRLQII